jgi:hypothetical protein
MQQGRRAVNALVVGLSRAAAAALVAGLLAALSAASTCRAQENLFELSSPLGPIAYTPGRGLGLGDTGLRLGGYSSLELHRDEGDVPRLSLAELSFFVIFDPFERVHLFSELEIEDLVRVDTKGHGGTADNRFEVERLYADLNLRDELQIRLGRFLTPVGRWNVIHAQPLVWTTSRPLVTDLPFDNNTTGAMLFGEMGERLVYSLFGQFVKDFESRPQYQSQRYSAGARLAADLHPGASIGATFLSFRDNHRWHQLGGTDLAWNRDPLELLAELTADGAEGLSGVQWGTFVQAAVATPLWVHLVGRYEYFDPRGEQPIHLVDLGIAYRPMSFLLLKAEYLIASRSSDLAEPGFKSSISLLF